MIDNYHSGRGAQINTTNRFSATEFVEAHIEGIDEQGDINHKRKIYLESPKEILSKNNSPDIPFTYSINPYKGCEHGCTYCYARNVHTYWGFSAGMDWENKIIVKKNAPELLEKAFLRRSWQPQTIALSGNTDPYQPIEKQMKITRELLKIFARYRNPVGIITKSALVARDVDLLSELADSGLVHVYFSVTTLDEKVRRAMEPRTSNAYKMMKAMKTLSEANVPVGVMMGPIIPSINDHEIDDILKAAADHGAVAASFTLARFNGDVAEIFADWLHKNFPDRASKVWNKVKSLHGGQVNDSRFVNRMRGEGKYADVIKAMYAKAKNKYFPENKLSPLRSDRFRRKGNLNLFD